MTALDHELLTAIMHLADEEQVEELSAREWSLAGGLYSREAPPVAPRSTNVVHRRWSPSEATSYARFLERGS